MKNNIQKSKKGGFPWWLILVFTVLLSWASLLIAGIMANHKRWIIWGIIYLIPVIGLFTMVDSKVVKVDNTEKISENNVEIKTLTDSINKLKILYAETAKNNFKYDIKSIERKIDRLKNKNEKLDKTKTKNKLSPSNGFQKFITFLFVISFIASFIHAFSIRKKYNKLRYAKENDLILVSKKEEEKKKKIEEQKPKIKPEYLELLEKLKQSYNEIVKIIVDNPDDTTSFIIDIKNKADKYIKQIELLAKKDTNISNAMRGNSIEKINADINEIQTKIVSTNNKELKEELEKSLIKNIEYKKSIEEFENQLEIIKLKISNAKLTIEKIKTDLIKMTNMSNKTEQERIFNDFHTASEDLSNYIDVLDNENIA